VWPILILLLVLTARLLRTNRGAVVTGGLGVVVALSLAYSVAETAAEPARAYFVTPTRVWELGAGALIAALVAWRGTGRDDVEPAPRAHPALRIAGAWVGWGLLLVTAFTFTGALPFPSFTAALPVLGAMAVITAHAGPGRFSPDAVTRLRPIQWLGDVSYSVYLWHWPLLVLLPSALGHALTWPDKLGVILATLGLAFLTKRFVEDRFRTAAWGRPLLKPFALAAAAMALVVAVGELQSFEVDQRAVASQQQVAMKLAHPTACFGAAALAAAPGRCPETRSGPLYPTPVQAAKAKPAAWDVVHGHNCFAHAPSYALVSCTHGPSSPRLNVALIGNSHAGQWYTTMEAVADAQHWHVTTYVASQCALSDTLQHLSTPTEDAACRSWGRRVVDRVLHGGYDLVVMANRVSVTAAGHPDRASSLAAYQQGYTTVLRRFSQAHLRVVVLRDTPAPGDGNAPGFSIPDCLAAHPSDYTACAGTRARWVPADPSVQAVAAVHDPRQQVLDLTDLFCGPTVCPAVVGQVPVYFDASHMTRTYGKTLAPYLGERLTAALRD
ncbi:MAG: acyltransferase family protein, partial [Amnibacterium sp.]